MSLARLEYSQIDHDDGANEKKHRLVSTSQFVAVILLTGILIRRSLMTREETLSRKVCPLAGD